MEKQFKRIQRDLNKFGGQPYITETDITVSQIIAKSVQGKSCEEIIEEYPQLSVHDIHQALAFVIDDLFKGVSYWRHDGMTPLTQIKGYSEILVGRTNFDDLDTVPDEQKQQWISIIHTSSQRGIARWQQMGQWMSKQYRPNQDSDTEVYEIERLIIDVVSTAQNYEPSLQIDVSTFDPQINIEIAPDTPLILGSLLAFAKNTFKPEVYISLDETSRGMTFAIHRQLAYPNDDIQKLITTPYNPIGTALAFFHLHDQNFDVDYQDNTVTYRVVLDIWIPESLS